MSTMTSPFLGKNGVNMFIFIWNFKMPYNTGLTKMSTYTNYLGQVHNKIFNKTSHTVIMLFSKNINIIINFNQYTHVSFGVLSIIEH